MINRIIGICMVAGCLSVVYLFESQSNATGVWRLLHWPAMVLTGMGPISLVIMCYDWHVLLRTIGLIFGKSAEQVQTRHEREAVVLLRLKRDYYQEGVGAFDNIKTKGLSEYVYKVIERLAVRIPVADIRDMLRVERDRYQIRMVQSLNVVALGCKLAPSMGMLGTILGMVNLLSTMSDPSKIGASMGLALLTTFFGLFFSLVVWTPIQQKLERLYDIELEAYDKVIRWLELLEKRKPADYFADAADISGAEQAKAS